MNRALGVAVAFLLPVCAGAEPHDIAAGGAYWDWQLTEPFDLTVDVRVFDLDPDSVTETDIAALKARGVKTVCYVSVGTWEPWREDADAFPQKVLGPVNPDWPDERYLDIRQIDLLLPAMRGRLRKCARLGFDAVEPDNMDLHEYETGLEISAADQVAWLEALIAEARGFGLEIAHKNAATLIPAMHDKFDFAILEDCFKYDYCEEAAPYLAAGKDVLAAEYASNPLQQQAICAYGEVSGIRFLFKESELTAGGRAC